MSMLALAYHLSQADLAAAGHKIERLDRSRCDSFNGSGRIVSDLHGALEGFGVTFPVSSDPIAQPVFGTGWTATLLLTGPAGTSALLAQLTSLDERGLADAWFGWTGEPADQATAAAVSDARDWLIGIARKGAQFDWTAVVLS